MDTFSQFALSPSTLTAIAAKGYTVPSPIQSQSIPLLLEGKDLIAKAQTGSGKTAAFGIPIIDRFRADEQGGVAALILVPTRELAIQVAGELEELAAGTPLGVVAIYGGAGFGRQKQALMSRKTLLLVATPGRLLDHIQQRTVSLGELGTLVLDEADRMLDMGFIRDVERIMSEVPQERHTMLFSATLSNDVTRLSKKYMYKPETVLVETDSSTANRVEQFRLRVEKAAKKGALLDILHDKVPERAIVFTRTKHLAKRLATQLQDQEWAAVALQGNMTQGQRERALENFRGGHARIMVATDVAARGLDIPEVTLVLNFDLPDGSDSYIHRIGRTARMGREGVSITFVQPDEKRDMDQIVREAGAEVRPLEGTIEARAGKGPDAERLGKLTPAPQHGVGPGRRGRSRSNNGGPPTQSAGPARTGGGGGGRRGGGGGRRGGAGRSSGGGGGAGRSSGGGGQSRRNYR